MGLCWRRPQVLLRKHEDINRGVNDLLKRASCVSAHDAFFADVHIDDLVEDPLQHLLVEATARHDIEVSRESRCDRVLATSWRAHQG